MTGKTEFKLITDVLEKAKRLGVEIIPTGSAIDSMKIVITDNNLYPAYDNGTCIYYGSFEEMLAFMDGWERAVHYFTKLGLITETKIKNANNAITSQRVFSALKGTSEKDIDIAG